MMDTKTLRLLLMGALSGALVFGLAACGDDDGDGGGNDGGMVGDDDDDDDMDGGMTGGDLGLFVPATGTAADNGGTPPGAPFDTSATYIGAEAPGTEAGDEWWAGWVNFAADDPAPGTCETVDSDITVDTTWDQPCYQLADTIFVTNEATLTIDAGVFVIGTTEVETALVITTEGRIEANGTAENPIIMTSQEAPGSRAPGDWGGLVMLGEAQINVAGGTNTIEGLPPGTAGGTYGGSDNAHDCGSLRYVRVEYAGFIFGENNELNAITLGGCGSATTLDFVMTSFGEDDGIEFFGGRPQLRHAIVNGTSDDSFDFDQGYVGTVQFGVIWVNEDGDKGFEWDNNGDGRQNTPFTDPTLWNVTVAGIATEDDGADPDIGSEAMRLREGVRGDINNVLMQDFAEDQCVDVNHVETKTNVEDGTLAVRTSLFINCQTDVRFDIADECTDEEPTCQSLTDPLTCPADGTADEYDCEFADGGDFTPPWINDATFGNISQGERIVATPLLGL